ncbi:hypothetical protein [Colwellia sp. 20A7]|uniref:hypothetical protein n=1 Tax=Colwellia sp. 20A7 TaxID=2689569 RepID=UPI001357DC43|nr:hypothetical protein [Colwellia sp. 20A7]
MNKLAVLAFSILIFLSTMLWYLANGSLNEYIKSQIELQGHYYSGQTTSLLLAEFSDSTNSAQLNQLTLANISHYQAENLLTVDEAIVELSAIQNRTLVTAIKKVTVNKLTINIEEDKNNINNIDQLIQTISLTLAKDYPQSYPAISAKIYAQEHPDLDAEQYAKNHPEARSIDEPTKTKKSRGKAKLKVTIAAINIKDLELNIIRNGITQSILKHNITIEGIGGDEGLEANQIGGEILLKILSLASD